MEKINRFLFASKPSVTLAYFRIAYGVLMLWSTLRFWLNGWIVDQFTAPEYHFKYFGFEFIEPLSETGFYILYGFMVLACLLIILGWYYRVAIVFFFLAFSYTELIDISYYLNHYYFISLLTGVLMFLPMHVHFSLDAKLRPKIARAEVPNWTIFLIKISLVIVYFYAGIAKLHGDWLFRAQPLSLWLQPHQDWWLIGPLFTKKWFAYAMSWGGCIFDLVIPFLLFNKRTVGIAFFFIVFFHLFTRMLFPIGMFPFIMIAATTIFFPVSWHQKSIGYLKRFLKWKDQEINRSKTYKFNKITVGLISVYLVFQLIFPFRYLLYPGNLFWTEEGFRFSWRVMLMEKGGTAFFYIHHPETGQKHEINNRDFLTPLQEKMMSTQPDLILQFAKIIKKHAEENGLKNPKITAEIYVSLNGRANQLYIDPEVNLATIEDNFSHKTWIKPMHHE
ncbi:MAG: HTTM domain-containing protein [Flavobacteriales bacterium]|jgi:hypothetical protein|nr:HTTM domain-containing protein [Flavobacteriales bacterium]